MKDPSQFQSVVATSFPKFYFLVQIFLLSLAVSDGATDKQFPDSVALAAAVKEIEWLPALFKTIPLTQGVDPKAACI